MRKEALISFGAGFLLGILGMIAWGLTWDDRDQTVYRERAAHEPWLSWPS